MRIVSRQTPQGVDTRDGMVLVIRGHGLPFFFFFKYVCSLTWVKISLMGLEVLQ